MAKRFDTTSKYLLELSPKDWLEYLGMPVAEAEVINANLETVIAEADKVLRVVDRTTFLVHLELQASLDPTILMRLLKYNVLLRERHSVSVSSVLLLLRPDADSTSITGTLRLNNASGSEYLAFRYQVVRAWQQPVARVLECGLYALPLALLSDLSGTSPEAVVHRMDERIRDEASPLVAGDLWTATYVLLGLRYNEEVATTLMERVGVMRESVTYQAILAEGEAKGEAKGKAEGKVEEAQRLLLLVGSRRLGEPQERIRKAIEAVKDLQTVEQLHIKLPDVESWDELLA